MFAAVGPARWSILLDRATRLYDQLVTEAVGVQSVFGVQVRASKYTR